MTITTNGLGSGAVYPWEADKANTGVEAPPTGLTPLGRGRAGCVFSSFLSRPAFLLGGVHSLSFWVLGSLVDQASPGWFVGRHTLPCYDVNVEVFQVDFEGVFLDLLLFVWPGSARRTSVALGSSNSVSGRYVLPIVFEPWTEWWWRWGYLLFLGPRCQGTCLARRFWGCFENIEDRNAVVFHAACRCYRFHCRRGVWSEQLLSKLSFWISVRYLCVPRLSSWVSRLHYLPWRSCWSLPHQCLQSVKADCQGKWSCWQLGVSALSLWW